MGRLADSAGPLITALTHAGFRVVAQPGLQIEAAPEKAIAERQLGQIHTDDLIVFASVPAVTHTFDLQVDHSVLQHATCAAVGPATAAALVRMQIEPISADQGSGSEALLQTLAVDPGLEALADRKAWILGAPDGRSLLQDQLQQWCQHAQTIHVYQRTATILTPECLQWLRQLAHSSAQPPCLIATSATILQHLTTLIDQQLKLLNSPLADHAHRLNRRRWRVLVNSERTAQTARELQYTQILTASSATSDALVETLRQSLRTG